MPLLLLHPCCLQEEAETLARALHLAALLSVTIPVNAAMRRVFECRGLTPQCRIVSWPAAPVALAAHEHLARWRHGGHAGGGSPAAAAASPPQPVSAQQPSILSALPAAAARMDSPAARQLLPHWRVCTSGEELESHLLRLREYRTASLLQPQTVQHAVGGVATMGEPAAPGALPAVLPESFALNWLPGSYELVPASSTRLQRLIGEGKVWLLGAPDAAKAAGEVEQQEPAAVLVCYGPGFQGVRYAGVVASSCAALESALLHTVAVADPLCCRWWVDCCGFDHPELWGSDGSGECTEVLPYYKPLAL